MGEYASGGKALKVDTDTRNLLMAYGAGDSTLCFNCGNCTAVCPLSEDGAPFPRSMVRWIQLGSREDVLRSPQPWLCYFCNECTATCPRGAKPGNTMAAARKFQIRSATVGPVADLLVTKRWGVGLLLAATALLYYAGLYAVGALALPTHLLFQAFVPEEVMHYAGMIAGIFAVAVMGVAIVRVLYWISRGRESRFRTISGKISAIIRSLPLVITEVIAQRRMAKCESGRPRWIAHMMTMWGFIGLFVTSGLVYMLNPGLANYPYSFTNPVQILANVSAVSLISGMSIMLIDRRSGRTTLQDHDYFDWVFFYTVFAAGITGVIVEAFRFSGLLMPTFIAYSIHIINVLFLIAFAPFSKFAHVALRPFVLWYSKYAGITDSGANAPAGPAGAFQ